ncbi:MAG: ribonuclease P protein component [Actinobacteria bacterium]|nr:ribonuclease P protein component [Actinomycetota bacterium]
MTERLRRRSDFARVFERGTYLSSDQLALRYLRRSDDGPSRFGFVIPRRVGGAVVRNRLRRRLKAILEGVNHSAGYDFVWIVRDGETREPASLPGEARALLEKSGTLGEVTSR